MFNRKTDKQTDRNRQYLIENQTDRQADRQIGKQTIYTRKERKKGGQTDYQTNRHNLERQKDDRHKARKPAIHQERQTNKNCKLLNKVIIF